MSARAGRRGEDPRADALEVLVRVEQGGWSDRLLAAAEPRLTSPRDRRFLHQLVLTALRWQLAVDARLAPHVRPGLHRIRPRTRAALRLAAAEALALGKPVPVVVDAALDALRRSREGPKAVGLANAVLRRALAEAAPLRPRESLPPWLWRRWADRLGEEAAEALAASMVRPSRPFLVARRDRGGREEVSAALARAGVRTEPSVRHPDGLVVVDGAPQHTPSFAQGDVIPVNEASALIAWLAAPDDGSVADLAAAPGGKAACLSQHAERVIAMDVHPGRTRLLARQLSWRTPTGRAVTVRANATEPPLAPGAVSAVLVDAPCSGTGTLRRRPEIRARLRPAAIRSCARTQTRILEAAAGLPAPGGSLTYAVCSLEPEEGIEQVARFLANHREYVALDPAERLGAVNRDLVDGDPPILLSRPEVGDHDGFVAALLVRR